MPCSEFAKSQTVCNVKLLQRLRLKTIHHSFLSSRLMSSAAPPTSPHPTPTPPHPTTPHHTPPHPYHPPISQAPAGHPSHAFAFVRVLRAALECVHRMCPEEQRPLGAAVVRLARQYLETVFQVCVCACGWVSVGECG